MLTSAAAPGAALPPTSLWSWHRTSAYSVASGDYAVSRSTVLEFDTGELSDRYSAWCGMDLLEQPRETSRPAQLLGIRRTAADAKALCEAHADQAQSGLAAPAR